MKLVTWFVAAVLTSAACGSGTETTPDAPVEPKKPLVGFTFEAVGDRSFASFGWTGIIHNVRVPDGTPFGVKALVCDGTDGICHFTGPVEPKSKVVRRRCQNRMSVLCTADSDCPVDGTSFNHCVYIYDPPTAIPQPATPPVGVTGPVVGGCGFSYIPVGSANVPTIDGTIDQTSGELNIKTLTINLQQNGAALSQTAGTYRGTCMECVGDAVANDGVKDGTCMAIAHPGQIVDPSPDLGAKCDVHRSGTLPNFEGNYSMDCSPTVKTGDTQNAFGGTFTSSGYSITITDASPSCSDPKFTGEKCFCGMCPDGVTGPDGLPKACTSNADCGGAVCGALPVGCDPQPAPFLDDGTLNPAFMPGFAPEQCRGAGITGAATRPNSCRGGVCNWDADQGLGTCISTLTNKPVGCYPFGMGAQIKAPGGATKIGSVFIVNTGTARCTRQQSAPVNGQLGLPGLTFQKRSFRVIPEFGQ